MMMIVVVANLHTCYYRVHQRCIPLFGYGVIIEYGLGYCWELGLG